jgi:hypothetical protein
MTSNDRMIYDLEQALAFGVRYDVDTTLRPNHAAALLAELERLRAELEKRMKTGIALSGQTTVYTWSVTEINTQLPKEGEHDR